jgi:hypothetical protein
MKHSLAILVLAAAALAAGCATSAQPTGGHLGQTLHVPLQRLAECNSQGGCALITRNEFERGMAQAYKHGAEEAAAGASCRRELPL